MSEDHAKLLEQNNVLEDIILRMLGFTDEIEDGDEGNFEFDPNSNPEDSVENNSDEYRLQLYQALADKNLVIPIRTPSSAESGNKSIETPVVEPLTQKSPLGDGENIIAFTSLEQMQSRLVSGPYIICNTAVIFKLVLEGGFEGLVINPGMYWVGIPAEDINKFFNIVD